MKEAVLGKDRNPGTERGLREADMKREREFALFFFFLPTSLAAASPLLTCAFCCCWSNYTQPRAEDVSFLSDLEGSHRSSYSWSRTSLLQHGAGDYGEQPVQKYS